MELKMLPSFRSFSFSSIPVAESPKCNSECITPYFKIPLWFSRLIRFYLINQGINRAFTILFLLALSPGSPPFFDFPEFQLDGSTVQFLKCTATLHI